MAEVIQLTRRQPDRPAAPTPETSPVTFYFDLASPQAYLAAERVERRFGGACWQPAVLWPAGADRTEEAARERALSEERARELRMPLVWPERYPGAVPKAMRIATFAAEQGCGSAFAIAAGRLAFCGGFDLEDVDMLAEAAAAAGLEVREALIAARAIDRDEEIVAAGRGIWADGARELPALWCEGKVYCGEPEIASALSRTDGIAGRPRVS